MNRIYSYIILLILLTNSIFWLILSRYYFFNFCLINLLILINYFFIRNTLKNSISVGFKIGFFVFSIIAFSVSIIMAVFSPSIILDNYNLLIIVLLLFSEFSIYVVINYFKMFNQVN